MTSIARCFALSVLLSGCTPEPGVEAEPPGRELNDPPPAPAGELVLDDAWTFIRGEHFGNESGSAIAVGDVTGDGLVDLVVNAPGRAQDVGTEDSGHSVYVFAGPLDAGRIDGGAADLGIGPPLRGSDLRVR